MDPGRFPRRILLCVTGLSPQIITETLYALAVKNQPPFIPTEIHLITTVEGSERVRLTLLNPEQGYFFRFCTDYGLDVQAIHFDETTLHLVTDGAGAALPDIRNEADNIAAADTITAVVRTLTADPANCVHASIAGGRKTMGFFLGYAMSLFGRPQDRLSHVLVSTPFESHPEFFFPPAKSRVMMVRDSSGRETKPVRTSDAIVTLADIPFVRLRDGLDEALLTGSASYSETVRRAQLSLAAPELVLDPQNQRVLCGGTAVTLPPVDFAFLAWFARRAQAAQPSIHWTEANAAEFLSEYRVVTDELSGDYERAVEALANGMNKEYFEQRASRLRSALRHALGPAAAKVYLPTATGRRPRTRYALTLKPEQIRFEPLE